LEFVFLCDRPKFTDTVTNWIYKEFIEGFRQGVSIEAIRDIYLASGKDALPVTILAVEEDKCIGTVSLVENDLKERTHSPWLASLYIDENHRGRGIGTTMIKEIEKTAKKLGYEEIYLRTEHAVEYYIKLGWEKIESLYDEFGLYTTVLRKRIG
jgi:predicted N-acetyltransferase YhbS